MQPRNSTHNSLPTIMEDPKEGNNTYVHSFPNNQKSPGGNTPQRPMGTGMMRGHVNKVTFNVRQPPTEAPNSTMPIRSNGISPQPFSNTLQNYIRSSERMHNGSSKHNFKNVFKNKFDGDYNPIDRPCGVIFEEDRRNAEYYSHLDEIDDEIIVSGAGDAPKCYETWGDANFHPTLQNTITKSGYTKPRKIQEFAIPIIADGSDLIGQSETGSGKTGAYLLPIIDEMLKVEWKSGRRVPFALIIAPTRELVLQIHEQARKFCDGSQYGCAKLYGQISNSYLQRELDSGCDILVATPGRLTEFLSKGHVHLNKLRYVVLDEADRLMEFNFAKEVTNILQSPLCAPLAQRQNLLFSATFPLELQKYFREWVKDNAVTIRNDRSNQVNKNIIHTFICVEGVNKNRMCADIIVAENEEAKKHGLSLRKTLVFVEKKKTSDMLALFLINNGIKALSINGDRSQEDREKALNELRSGNIDVLVATDVAARGIDICGLDHVIIVELPNDFMTFIHRVGRTGRIKEGEATTFYDPKKDYILANDISNMLRKAGQEVPDFIK
uniref:RNA helicase n=1 Tax=Strongyloides venezuelensis TaxID=75913 RepID=A0A0K0F6D0_STRVS